MYASFYKEKLYPLQDEVLSTLADVDTSFYLTGGTALRRCYLHHRYSDDLDFFQNQSASFENDVQLSLDKLKHHFIVHPAIRDVGFYRVLVSRYNTETQLKIEWINDVAYHRGDFMNESLFPRIDSHLNILSNKVFALSRNAAKDVADLIFLSLNYQFSWKEIINDARQKDTWVNEIVASQIIYEFNLNAFANVAWIDEANKAKDFSAVLKTMSRDLLHGFDNSLCN